MRRIILSVSFADTFRATLTSGLLVLGSLVILQTQLINSASAEVTFLNTWGNYGTGDGEFDTPWGIALSDTGQVYVADTYNDRIQRFFDSEAWGHGTNTFVNGSAGPQALRWNRETSWDPRSHSMRVRDLSLVIQPRSMQTVPF